MNKEILIMIELQHLWDNVLSGREGIEQGRKRIAFWEAEVKGKKEALAALEQGIKKLKNQIKQDELDLATIEEKISKLETRRTNVQNQKELNAVTTELETLGSEKGLLEERTLAAMEDLDAREGDHRALQEETARSEEQLAIDVRKITAEIDASRQLMEDNQKLYNELSAGFTSPVKAKFEKLLSSKGGKGIGEVRGEICGSCNFQIPASLAQDASRNDKIATCSNCGRFLYKR